MRFDYDAYGKVFPAKQPQITTDSAIEGYNPTAEEAQTATPAKVESAVEVENTNNTPSDNAQPPKSVENAESGINDHEGGTTSGTGEIEP